MFRSLAHWGRESARKGSLTEAGVLVASLIGLLSVPPLLAGNRAPRPSSFEVAQAKPVQGKPAREEPAAADSKREPATVEQAARVLDLRTFPMLKGAEAGDRRLGSLMYSAKSDVRSAFDFQRQHLKDLGWKELPGSQSQAAYASGNYAKDGYVAYVTVSQNSDPKKADQVMVAIGNYGNVALDKLPAPKGVKPFYPSVFEASYITEAKVPETAEECRKLLVADGWEPYGTASSDPQSPMLYFKKNAIRLMAWVSSAPAQGGKTVVRYSSELMSADLPMPPAAPDPRYDDGDKSVRFDWPGEDGAEVVTFYKTALAKQDWKPTTAEPVVNQRERESFLVFRNPQGDMVTLDMKTYKDIVRVAVTHRSSVEVAEAERRVKEEAERRREELAKKKTANPPVENGAPKTAAKSTKKPGIKLPAGVKLPDGIELPEVGELPEDVSDAVNKALEEASEQLNAAKKNAAGIPKKTTGKSPPGSLKIADFPIPKEAWEVEYSKITKMVSLKASLSAEELAAYFTEKLTEAGWTRDNPKSSSSILKVSNGDTQVTIFVHDKPEGSDATVMAKALNWDSVPASRKDPAKAAARKQAREQKESDEVPSREPKPEVAARKVVAGPKVAPADQKQDGVRLTIAGTVYKLPYGVAFESQRDNEPVTTVLLAEKPIAADKAIALLNQDKDVDDAIGFQRHLKLRYDQAGKLSYLFMYAEGLSINLGNPGPDKVEAEIAVKEGRAVGKAVMPQPEDFFDKNYRIEAVFDAKLATAAAGASDSPAPAGEPGVDELVADEGEGLPAPVGRTSRQESASPYSRTAIVVIPSTIESVTRFYRKELADRGWKENAAAAKVAPDGSQLSFTGPEGSLSVKISKAGDDVTVNMVSRNTEKAKAAGIVPQPNRGRLILGNASNQEATITINGRQYKVPAGRGAKDPKDGTSLHVLPGKYNVSMPGQADAKDELNIAVDETWGVIVLPTGGLFADRLY